MITNTMRVIGNVKAFGEGFMSGRFPEAFQDFSMVVAGICFKLAKTVLIALADKGAEVLVDLAARLSEVEVELVSVPEDVNQQGVDKPCTQDVPEGVSEAPQQATASTDIETRLDMLDALLDEPVIVLGATMEELEDITEVEPVVFPVVDDLVAVDTKHEPSVEQPKAKARRKKTVAAKSVEKID